MNRSQRSTRQRNRVYLVIHDKLPTYSMYFRDHVYSEPIETVNSTIVGVYSTEDQAETAARNYFFDTLGYHDDGQSENGGYHCTPEDGHCGTWDEEVWVDYYSVQA